MTTTQPAATVYETGGAYRTTNGLAAWSLAMALLWGFGVLSIVAIIFGHRALGQIKRRGQDGRELAITGLIFGYLGLIPAFVVSLTALLTWSAL